MRKTKKAYEEYLNGIYSGDEAWDIGQYMLGDWIGKRFHACARLLEAGKYGTALRRYDPIAFEVGCGEWRDYEKE